MRFLFYERLNSGIKQISMKRKSQIKFWKVGQPLFSDKSIRGDKANLTEDGEHIKAQIKEAVVLSSLLSSTVKNLKISQFSSFDRIIQKIKVSTIKVIVKYKNH